jgi:hypothetical protein
MQGEYPYFKVCNDIYFNFNSSYNHFAILRKEQTEGVTYQNAEENIQTSEKGTNRRNFIIYILR